MVRWFASWALGNPLVIILMALALLGVGLFSVINVNVEAYPDPAPAIVEVVAQMPGASAEEVERQVTVPLEVTFAGMPGLKVIRSQSLFGLSDLKMNWNYGYTYEEARQEVINRLATISQPLPPGVTPGISPESPTGEIYRYILKVPKYDSGPNKGKEIYTLNDLKALQDWVLEREFRTVPRIVDVTSFGGTVRRYEVQPDPDRLRRYGINLNQLQTALTNSNQTVGGDYVNQGQVALTVRSVGLFGGGADPVNKVLGLDLKVLNDFVRNELVPEVVLGDAAKDAKVKERVAQALVEAQFEPPLSQQEQAQVETIQRLQQALALKEVQPPLNEDEKALLATVMRKRERLNLGLGKRPPEQSLLQGIRASLRPKEPGLTEEEKEQVESIRRRAALRAAAMLRSEEQHRIRDIRGLVITSTNNVSVRVEDVVEGGRLDSSNQLPGAQGVVVSYLTRLGRIGYFQPDRDRPSGSHLALSDTGHDEDDKVQCIVLLRKGEETIPALKDVKAKVQELNDPASGRMLPGVEIVPYYDRTDLLHVTTETVAENLLVGVVLVVLILLMFLGNVRTAIIVAINIPLALLFAFSVLFLRGKSANLLSIGAVDFGIIVDSSVIMVENIYRHLSSGKYAGLPLKERIINSVKEIDKALLFSTLIMVCAFIPLFTMTGPEGQLFGPMATTYAFSLFGALLLALTLSPVLCMLLFKRLKPVQDSFLVRFMKRRYLWQLALCLKYRWVTIGIMGVLIVGTICLLPLVGNEFMPELEEGNIWIRGTGPLNQTLERNVDVARQGRAIVASYPEVESIVSQSGRPDDGTDTCGYYNTEYFVPLRPEKNWPAIKARGTRLAEYKTRGGRWLVPKLWYGLRDRVEVAVFGRNRPRSKEELVDEMNAELAQRIPGVVWNFSQNIRDNVMEAMSGVKGDNSVKIFGPDIDQLERLAAQVKNELQQVQGIENVGIFHIRGQSHLEFRVDPIKCERYGVMTADVNNVVASALGALPQSNMVEGEKLFPIAIRWPLRLRASETSILDIPVDIINNQVVLAQGSSPVPKAQGFALPPANPFGSAADTTNPMSAQAPRLRLRDLVSPVGEDGSPDPNGQFERHGASDIYRETGKRMIAIKFSVRGRDLGGAVAEARDRTAQLPDLKSPYRTVWSGEFEEMEDAEARLLWIVPLALGLIFILLYAAFRSFLDSVVVISNVIALSLGGIWSLLLTHTNFSISAAVGFMSLFGVAIMDGLLLIASFNQGRAHNLPLLDAIMQGAEKRLRPVTMTALTAILGLLPAALSTRIGSQTQRPLAIVVVGGMLTTLFLTRYLMPVLYSLYGHREPPEGAGSMAH
ncbi:MAG TPA: efflux RND transporter permease subunit [Gemmataceae bacterium]|nr:efflux RND transporter permease subunit [Gemmataceae bacterium]